MPRSDPARTMLREASLAELRRGAVPRCCRVLVNRGRGNDELAPAEALLAEFMAMKRLLERRFGKGSAEAHNRAFLACRYEERFRQQIQGDPVALERLRRLAERARHEEVYLVCYEGLDKACHRRILLRIAQERFGAAVEVRGVEPA